MMRREEMLEKIRVWLKLHRKEIICGGAVIAAAAVLAGMSLRFLRDAPLPADRDAAVQQAVSLAEEKQKTAAEKSQNEQFGKPGDEPEEKPEEKPEGKSEKKPKEKPEEKPKEIPVQKNAAQKVHEKETPVKGTPEQTSPVQENPAQASPTQGNPTKASSAQEVHEHDWVPVTSAIHRDAVTHVVHHDAVTETVHHEAVSHEEPVYEFRTICNTCGADITGHIPDHIGPVCQGSYSTQQVETGVNVITDREAYDEEVVVKEAWDEIVVDREASDEEITTGYRCRLCGRFREADQ